MWCEKCKETDWDKLKVIKEEQRYRMDPYTHNESIETIITIKCLSCGYEFEECI